MSNVMWAALNVFTKNADSLRVCLCTTVNESTTVELRFDLSTQVQSKIDEVTDSIEEVFWDAIYE